MKKLNRLLFTAICALACGGLALSLGNDVAIETKAEAAFNHDYLGGAHIHATSARAEDVGNVTEINVNNGNGDYSGTGIYVRMRNYTDTVTPITFKINSTNTAIIAPNKDVKQTYYDVNGVEVYGCDARGFGNYLMLPAWFDGYVYMNYTSQMTKIAGGDNEFNPSSIWRIYVEYSGSYDAYANFAIGDIFTDQKTVVDTSEIAASDFSSIFINQGGSTAYQSVEQLSATRVCSPTGNLLGGVRLQTTAYAGADFQFGYTINATSGLWMRIRNDGTASCWPKFVLASDWWQGSAPSKANSTYYRISLNGLDISEYPIDGYGYFELPAGYDGFIYFPSSSFAPESESFHFTNVNQIDIQFAANGNLVIGDFGTDNTQFAGQWWTRTMTEKFVVPWTSGGCTASIEPGYYHEASFLFADDFLASMTCDASGVNAPTFAEGKSWSSFKEAFNALSDTEKDYLRSAESNVEGDAIEQAIARYEYLVMKYGYEDFMTKGISAQLNLRQIVNVAESSNSLITIICILTISSLLVTSLVIKTKKEK